MKISFFGQKGIPRINSKMSGFSGVVNKGNESEIRKMYECSFIFFFFHYILLYIKLKIGSTSAILVITPTDPRCMESTKIMR